MERNSGVSSATWVDVFDRVLGKGIVVEASELHILPGGLMELADARIVVLSIDTYWRLAHQYPSAGRRRSSGRPRTRR